MKKPLTVLVSSAGRRVGLVECFRRDAEALDLSLRIVAADAHPELSAACATADATYRVPKVTSDEFLGRLEEIAFREDAELIVPTIDTELAILAAAAPAFESRGVRVVVSGPQTVGIARDKMLTSEVLQSGGIATPRTTSIGGFLDTRDSWMWPVVVKPIDGSSSKGLRIVHDMSEFAAACTDDRLIVQEFLAGPEFTVNVFFDRGGEFRAAVPHQRLEVRAGEVSKGVTTRVPQLEATARRLKDVLPDCRGPLCFQAMLSNGEATVFEINARFGGGFPLAHAAGAPFTRWLLEEARGLAATSRNDWNDGVLMLRYDQQVFRTLPREVLA